MYEYALNEIANGRGFIGLKLVKYDSFAKCVQIIRKYRYCSIADIKKAVEENDYIIKVGTYDDSGLTKISRCYKALSKLGATIEIYNTGIPISYEVLENMRHTYADIEAEIDAEIEREVEAEGEE